MGILCISTNLNNCFRFRIKYSHRLATWPLLRKISPRLYIDRASRCSSFVAGLVRDNKCNQCPTPPSLSVPSCVGSFLSVLLFLTVEYRVSNYFTSPLLTRKT